MPPVLVDSGYRTSATYRLADPIENMQLEVTLRKRGTRGERRMRDAASEKPKGPRKPGRGSIAFDEGGGEGGDEGGRNTGYSGGDGPGRGGEYGGGEEGVGSEGGDRLQQMVVASNEVQQIQLQLGQMQKDLAALNKLPAVTCSCSIM